MQQSLDQLKITSWKLRYEPLSKRKEYLLRLRAQIEESQKQILRALYLDFKKPASECILSEYLPTLEEIDFAIRHLDSWAAPVKVARPLSLFTTSCYLQYEPKGLCLIISPWNYPFLLALGPVIAAIAAGNSLVLKPSELTPHTSQLLAEIIRKCFSPDHIMVCEGGKEVSEKLLEHSFDHIFFTGSTAIGRVVMQAASKHLASVTLELGGKSPCIVDESCDLKMAAEKIAWGKFLNAGQTCVAPDYLYVNEKIYDSFLEQLKTTLKEYYPDNGEKDLARIISVPHFTRLRRLFDQAIASGAKLFSGGEFNNDELLISPTILLETSLDQDISKEEIFGPLLPVIKYQNLSEVISTLQSQAKPLALYFYSTNASAIEQVLKYTSSGGVCINDNVLHLANPHLPFGGVGTSGLGSYHGVFGFKAFSHEKAVLVQSSWARFIRLIYPPYNANKTNWLLWLARIQNIFAKW